MNIKQLCESVIKLFEKKESLLDERSEQGAIDFKIFIIERYYQLVNMTNEIEEKTSICIKYFKLVNKYLKNEIEEVGFKINKYWTFFIKIYQGGINLRAFKELFIYINENAPRVVDIWNINKNIFNNKLLQTSMGHTSSEPEKKLIKNSFEILGYTINPLLLFPFNSNNIPPQQQGNEFLMELQMQRDHLLENIKQSINSIKIIEKENFDINFKEYELEKYFFFIINSVYLLYVLENKCVNVEEAEIICYIFQFILKNSTNYFTIQYTYGCLEKMLKINQSNNEIIPFNDEFLKNWKNYYDDNMLSQNKYKSTSKYNLIIRNIIKYYSFFFTKQRNNEQNKLFGCIIKDGLKTINNLMSKINDFRIYLDLKNQILKIFFTESQENFYLKDIKFDNLYHFLKQITSFYQIILSLNNDYIATYIKEEKQMQKDIFQKNMLKINIEENDNNYIQKNNLNHLFLVLLRNKYDKYIYIEDPKVLYEFMKNTLDAIKICIKNINNLFRNENSDKKCELMNKISVQLSRFFFYYYYIFSKTKTNHQNHDNQGDLIDELITIYVDLYEIDTNLFNDVFKRLMPYIFKLFKLGCKICPNKNCILTKLIHNIFKTINKEGNKEAVKGALFIIYFEYFSSKIYETGNPMEKFHVNPNNNLNQNNILSESINQITILKSIFFNLLDCVEDCDYFRNKVIPLIIDFLYLSKNSDYYGNYIYILRCFFKYLKTAINVLQNPNVPLNNTERNRKTAIHNTFNIEINYILYAIIKYLINIKEQTPFLSSIISETISIMPIKLKYLIDMPNLILPTLAESLSNSSDNIPLNIMNLENWMNYYPKRPEAVVPYIQQNISKITDSLYNNIRGSMNMNISLALLKWISKMGRKTRNYSRKQKIITKTCPTQIMALKLKEKRSERTFYFILDDIIDININNSINWSNKIFQKKKITLSDKKLINNYIEIFKNCLASFFHTKIDYDYIINVKKNIINGINFNEDEFNSSYSFKKMNAKNTKIKINSIYRKKEHLIIDRLITGIFLINSSFSQIQNNQKEQDFNGNNIMDFISNYVLLILLSKEKNNQNILLFEIDPIIFLDKILMYLYSSQPTIIRNTNAQYTEYSLNILNYIIDSINSFFDNDYKIIQNLEIVKIIYMKFINCCYVNDSQKKESGLMLLKILLQKFDKSINYKYLKYFFKCLTNVTSNYSNIVKIQLKKSSNILVEIIDILVNMFVVKDDNYYKLNEDDFSDNNKNKDEDILSDEENEIKIKAKNNFIMFFDFIKYSFDEIVEKIDSSNNYTRNFGMHLLKKIIGNFTELQRILPILFQIDISKLTINQFYGYLKDAGNQTDIRNIIRNCNYNKIGSKRNVLNNNKYILEKYNKSKIYNKIDFLFNALTKKVSLRDKNLTTLIACSDALNNLFNNANLLIKEYIYYNNNEKINLLRDLISSLYFNILVHYFGYCYIYTYFNSIENFRTKLTYLFIEKLFEEKDLEFQFKIKDRDGKDIIIINEVKEDYIEYIEKYIFEKEIVRNAIDTRDYFIGELFEYFGLKIIMVKQYIELLNNIFTKVNLDEYSIYKKDFDYYKMKITRLIFVKIFNIHSSSILKVSSSFLNHIFKNDSNLRETIYKENYGKILDYIGKINEENIKNSNCIKNLENITGLHKDYIDTLLIICKCMKIDKKMKNELIKKIQIFENIDFNNFNNSQYVLFYGYISLFLYIDIKEEEIKQIFDQLLCRIKETIMYSSKNFLHFRQTQYYNRLIKLLIKYRKQFSKYIIDMYENKNQSFYIFSFIKNLNEKSTILTETIFTDIADKIKNEIILEENNKTDENITKNVNKLAYFLKICRIIAVNSPIYLKKTSFINIIDDFIIRIIDMYDNNYEQLQDKINYDKVIKYWLDFNKIYFDHIKIRIKNLLSMCIFKSKKNVSKIEINKIVVFLTYRIIVLSNDKTNEKYKSIMEEFIKLDEEIIKYFDILVEYLIIPMMIRHLKNFNYFKCFSVSINKDNTLKIDIKKKKKKKIIIKKKKKKLKMKILNFY